jgi:hypothetical protein
LIAFSPLLEPSHYIGIQTAGKGHLYGPIHATVHRRPGTEFKGRKMGDVGVIYILIFNSGYPVPFFLTYRGYSYGLSFRGFFINGNSCGKAGDSQYLIYE